MRIAIVHEWLARARGAERFLDAVCETFPDADLFTLFDCGEWMPRHVRRRRVQTSFLQHMPRKLDWYRQLLPVMPMAVESFDLRGYDLVLSSHFCVAKGAIAPSRALHVCYVHSPPRWIWEQAPLFFAPERVGIVGGVVGAGVAHYLRMWDVATAGRPHVYLANARHIADAVAHRYGRPAQVLYPPVDVGRFAAARPFESGDYYLSLGGLVPQKRVDLAILACNRLGRRLKVVGAGSDEARLRALAGPTIEVVRWPSDAEVEALHAGARALLFPGCEDFGIAMVEALASGRPVIAYGQGGAREILRADGGDLDTGIFFDEQSVDSVVAGILAFENRRGAFRPSVLRAAALRFDRPRFVAALRRFVYDRLGERTPAALESIAS